MAFESALDADVLDLGRRLSHHGRRRVVRQTVERRALSPLIDDRRLRDAMFRVVDVAPACAGPRELAEHFEAFIDEAAAAGDGRGLVPRLARLPRSPWLTGCVIRRAVRGVATRFILAESMEAAAEPLGELWKACVANTLDLLGESSVSHGEADAYARRCRHALTTMADASTRWPEKPLLERDSAGEIPRVNLSVKATALTPLVRADAPERGHDDLARRLRPLLRHARERGAHVHVDMESVDARDLTLAVVLDLMSEPEFAQGPSMGVVLQAYLRDCDQTLDHILERVGAARRGSPLTIRLVKGAYWDHETIKAAQNGWESPVWTHKFESDRAFERLARRLIDAFPAVRPAIASHNLRSVAHAVAYNAAVGREAGDLEVQVLRGLGDDLQDAAAAQGLRVRTYCPVGDMVAGMGYLVRRLLENSSNDSFLASRMRGSEIDRLLERP